MGNHLVASPSELAASDTHGKRDVADRRSSTRATETRSFRKNYIGAQRGAPQQVENALRCPEELRLSSLETK